jgi:sulfofructose kinase
MPAPKVEVLAIGHASYDLTFVSDHFPSENSKVETDQLLEEGGGPAANAAFLLSKWGVNCAFAGLLGDDDYGRRISAQFAAVGIDLSLTEVRPRHLTPVSVILVNAGNGSRTIVNRKTPQAALRLDPLLVAQISPRVLLFDGHELDAAETALVAFPNAVSILDGGSLRAGTAALAKRVNHLVASERFALQSTGLPDLVSDENQRACLRQLRAPARPGATLVVTLGEQGLIYEVEGECRHLLAYPAEARDTTGAGDVFHGAYAYGVLGGLPFGATLRLALKAASLSVQKFGARQSIPDLELLRKELPDVG